MLCPLPSAPWCLSSVQEPRSASSQKAAQGTGSRNSQAGVQVYLLSSNRVKETLASPVPRNPACLPQLTTELASLAKDSLQEAGARVTQIHAAAEAAACSSRRLAQQAAEQRSQQEGQQEWFVPPTPYLHFCRVPLV